MIGPDILDEPPTSDLVTSYDERHLKNYLRLLDADAEGADWREAVLLVFGVDPDQQPEAARRFYNAHLSRAGWMTRVGYLQLAARGHEMPQTS